MPLKDQIKNYAKKLVENRPGSSALSGMVRVRKPLALTFRDDGIVPNNPSFPLLVYRGAVVLSTRSFDPATVIDTLFETNAWGRSWRDTVYDFVHYHSQVHEVMGVARGTARLECGGVKGRIITMKAGDVAVLPAGTGHRSMWRRSRVYAAPYYHHRHVGYGGGWGHAGWGHGGWGHGGRRHRGWGHHHW
jgi:uncharacterized protein YjlB